MPFIVAKIPPDTLNEIATSAWLNIFFFIVFVAFAISFFGYYEISLPSSLANKADSASGVGGILGVFFMAITLALVSFSCTGPILGSFLAGTLATNPDPYNICPLYTSEAADDLKPCDFSALPIPQTN